MQRVAVAALSWVEPSGLGAARSSLERLQRAVVCKHVTRTRSEVAALPVSLLSSRVTIACASCSRSLYSCCPCRYFALKATNRMKHLLEGMRATRHAMTFTSLGYTLAHVENLYDEFDEIAEAEGGASARTSTSTSNSTSTSTSTSATTLLRVCNTNTLLLRPSATTLLLESTTQTHSSARQRLHCY